MLALAVAVSARAGEIPCPLHAAAERPAAPGGMHTPPLVEIVLMPLTLS